MQGEEDNRIARMGSIALFLWMLTLFGVYFYKMITFSDQIGKFIAWLQGVFR